MAYMRVSDLAERSGVPASTVRYYERRGLLPADRSPTGYRLYDDRALDRLAFITTAKRLGLDLDEVAELTVLWSDHSCAEVKAALRPRLAQRLAQAHARAEELDVFRSRLRRAQVQLEALPDRADACEPHCAFLASLRRDGSAPTPLPIIGDQGAACRLPADQHEARIGQWRGVLAGAMHHQHRDGRTWHIEGTRAGVVADLASAELECCAFFDLRIDFAPGVVLLHVTVEPGQLPEPDSPAGVAVRLLAGLPAAIG